MNKIKDKTLIVYQAPWNWSFLWNRAQPLATSLSKYCTVVYVDSGTVRPEKPFRYLEYIPGFFRILRKTEYGRLRSLDDRLFRYSCFWMDNNWRYVLQDRNNLGYMFLDLSLKQLLNTYDKVWLLTSRPSCSGLLDLVRWDKVIVDIEDPWLSLSYGPKLGKSGLVENLLDRADVIFANGSKIAADYQSFARNPIFVLPNAVDDWFIETLNRDQLPCPDFMQGDDRFKLAVYLGHINDRMDFALIEQVVRESKSFQFYFIGVENVPREERGRWEKIKTLEKFHYIKAVSHKDVPAILQHADVLLLPHVTMGTPTMFPAKAYEYLAAGKPILTSFSFSDDVGEIPSLILCEKAETYVDTLRAIENGNIALTEEAKQKCLEIALKNTWGHRAIEFLNKVEASTGTIMAEHFPV